MAQPRMTALSFCINASCVTLALPLMIPLTLSSSDLMLFFARLISNLLPYLRTFWLIDRVAATQATKESKSTYQTEGDVV